MEARTEPLLSRPQCPPIVTGRNPPVPFQSQSFLLGARQKTKVSPARAGYLSQQRRRRISLPDALAEAPAIDARSCAACSNLMKPQSAPGTEERNREGDAPGCLFERVAPRD